MVPNCCKTKESQERLEHTATFLKTIAEVNRLKILCMLHKEELCVCDIWKHLGLSQNLVSHHLKVLKDFGLVSSRKQGTKVLYSLNREVTDAHWLYVKQSIISNNYS